MEELMQKAESGDAEAQLLLGLAYYNGDQKIQRFVGEIMPMLEVGNRMINLQRFVAELVEIASKSHYFLILGADE